MNVKSPRRSKFAEFMADHIFADENRDKLSAVVYADRAADHLGSHRRAPRPGANDLPLTRLGHRGNLFQQMGVDKGTLFNRTRHGYLPFLL